MTTDNRRPVSIVRYSLFQGDAERLEPHLDFLSSGCLYFNFDRPKLLVKLEWLFFHDGKITVESVEIPLKEPGEITFSVKEDGINSDGRDVLHGIVSAAGRHFHTIFRMPMITDSSQQIKESIADTKFTLSDNTSVQLWTMIAGKNIDDKDLELPFEDLVNRYENGYGLRLSIS